MAKMIIFQEQPNFLPMLNPWEILQFGVHEGTFYTMRDMTQLSLIKRLKQNTEDWKYKSTHSRKGTNFFKEHAINYENPQIHSYSQKVSEFWLAWYIEFYYNKNTRYTGADLFIDHWKRTLVNCWEVFQSNEAGAKDKVLEKRLKQTMLEYGWYVSDDKQIRESPKSRIHGLSTDRKNRG